MLTSGKMTKNPSYSYREDLHAEFQRPWGCPQGQGSLTPLEGYWRTGFQAGPENPLEKFLLVKNPTSFILQ